MNHAALTAKTAFRAELVGAADLFATIPAYRRCPLALMAWGLMGGDAGDGTFVYEPADAREDLLRVLMHAIAQVGTEPRRLRILGNAIESLGLDFADRANIAEINASAG